MMLRVTCLVAPLRAVVGDPGLEPGMTGPEPGVLPITPIPNM
jgi:hypothetical protein